MKYHLTGRCLLRLYEGGIPCGAFFPGRTLGKNTDKKYKFSLKLTSFLTPRKIQFTRDYTG